MIHVLKVLIMCIQNALVFPWCYVAWATPDNLKLQMAFMTWFIFLCRYSSSPPLGFWYAVTSRSISIDGKYVGSGNREMGAFSESLIEMVCDESPSLSLFPCS